MMATNITHTQHVPDLDSAKSDFKDSAIKRVPVLHIFKCASAGRKICLHIHRGLACLHIPPDGKQSADRRLKKLAESFEQTLNGATLSTKSNSQHKISVISCMVADLLLRKTSRNKPFQPHKFHIPYSLQLSADCNLFSVNSVCLVTQRFRKQTKDVKRSIKIKINDSPTSHKQSLKISPTLISASDSSFYMTNVHVDSWHKESMPCLPRISTNLDNQGSLLMELDAFAVEISDQGDLSSTMSFDKDLVSNCMKQQQIIRFDDDMTGYEATLGPGTADDLVMLTDEEDNSDDDLGLIPQFDGASDKVSDSQMKSDPSKVPTTVSTSTECLLAPGDAKIEVPGSDQNAAGVSDMTWRTSAAGRGLESSQNYSSASWPQPGWPQQSGGGPWHGQSWPQQNYESWPQHCIPSSFSPQQAPFQPPSSATSFQSPPNNPYASPTHQQTFQAQSQRQYHYPPYQSPTSNQPFQQTYQSPSQSQHPYQSARSSQAFNTPQTYNSSSSHQPYQSSAGQSFQPMGVPSQSYQSSASNKPYQSSTGNQPYGPQSAGLPYQSPSSSQPFQQSSSAQIYPSQYQTSHQATHPQLYQSPGPDGCCPSQPSWNPQSYSGYNQGHMRSNEAGTQNKPEQHLGKSSQAGSVIGQPHNPISEGQGSLFSSGQEQTDASRANKPAGKTSKKKNIGAAKFKSQSPCMSPTPLVSKSPLQIKSSSSDTPPLTSDTRYFHSESKDNIRGPLDDTEDNKSIITSENTSITLPAAKISTLEFKPDIASFQPTLLSKEPSTSRCIELLNSAAATRVNTHKFEKNTSTPMIQQLLMEEPVRMKIKKEDREAVMKKPMASPTLPKPKRKYKARVKQSEKILRRPRSTSLSSPVPQMMGYCGYSPQPIMNPPIIGRPGRSHSISLPFSCEPRMSSPVHNYGWQQWKHQSFPSNSQLQQQWGVNDRHNFNNCGEPNYNTAEIGCKHGQVTSNLQHTSFNVNTVQSSIYQNNLQPNQNLSLSQSQNSVQNNITNSLQISTDSSQTFSSRENVSEKSSLSSLLQLISDVDSDDTAWENASVSVIPNLFSSSNDSENFISMPITHLNQGSPQSKDFITLESPCKQESDKAYSDTAGMTSSEESDRMDLDLTSDLKLRAVSRAQSLGCTLPRVGKQNRVKKLGLLLARNTKLGSASSLTESNPAYTYTFNVPTTVFKKLKFFRSAESRKHIIKVVRMHPMDARRYSLLKIGREIVKVVKLTEAELASYNVTLLPTPFASSDGCTNRVNLDIPTVSADKQSDDKDKTIFSKFDTDFPPNKVAPPSSFCVSQISASVTRTSSTTGRHSSLGSNWMHQYSGHQPINYNGGISPLSQHTYSPQDENFPCDQQQGSFQNVLQGSVNRQSASQLPEHNSSGQFNQKTNSSYSHTTSSTNQDSYYTNQQSVYINRSQQQQQSELEQQQADSGGLHPEPKNGLRSPGQHGLTSRIESGRLDNISGDQKVEIYDSTTKSSHFNTRVNAQICDNHAEHVTKYAVAQHIDACTSQQQSTEHKIHMKQVDNLDELFKQDNCNKRLTVRTTQDSSCHYSPEHDDSISTLSKNSNEKTGSKCALENYDDVPQKSSQMNKLEKNNIHTSFIMQPDKRRGLCRRKNTKSLSLKIPKQSDLSQQDFVEDHSSSDYLEKGHTLNSQDEWDEDCSNNRRVISGLRRSTRSSTLEGVRAVHGSAHSSRQAKLRSLYSKCSQNLKPKKRRKRLGPQIEGVHYIVVGKFKGHKAMLVKIRKLNINPTEQFRADIFEELASKDIVRLISPVDCHRGRMDDESENAYYSNNSTDSQSDTEMHNPHFGFENPNRQPICRSRSVQRPSRGRSMQHVKFRSVQASSGKQGEVLQKLSQTRSLRNNADSKNVMAGPTSGASENNIQNAHFVEDRFFSEFKESFIQHFRVQKHVLNSEFDDSEMIFFEGVKRSSFYKFKQKFKANVQKLKYGDYSSSSDDEDDVLDSTILKEKIDESRKLKVSEVSSEVLSNKLVNKVHVIAKSDLCATAVDKSSLNSDDRRKSSSLTASNNAQENERVYKFENGSCITIDDASNTYDKRASCNDIILHSIKGKAKFQERDNNKRQPIKNHEDYECNTKLVMKDMLPSKVEESNVYAKHCLENSMSYSVTNSNTMKGDEDKEDYLKCQMAFFEDISSDSDSNETVITESYIGKENVFQGYSTEVCTRFPFNVSYPDKYAPNAGTKGMSTQENHHRSDFSSSDLRFDHTEVSRVCGLNHKPEVNIQVCDSVSQILDKSVKQVSHIPAPGFSKGQNSIFKPTEEHEGTSFAIVNNIDRVEDNSAVKQDTTMSDLTLSSGKVGNHIDTPKVIESKIIDTNKDDAHNTETRITAGINNRQRCGKRMKKSNRDRSALIKRRQQLDDKHNICNEETSCISGQTKCINQRKKTFYSHHTEEVDSGGDDSSDSSNEDFATTSAQYNSSKNSRKVKGSSKDRQQRSQPEVSVSTGRGTRGGLRARGRRKRPPGGDKLLSSLSLLHMATLASLTETPDGQSEAITQAKNEEHSWQHTDRLRTNCNNFPLTPGERFSTSPVLGLSTGKKRKKTGRNKYVTEDTALSQTLIPSQDWVSVKPGCSGAYLGSKQSSFNRIGSNLASSSQISSNFTFNLSSDSNQHETANPAEETNTCNILQLLETRRAQVNCASFSMKDILKLTTDGCMDSELAHLDSSSSQSPTETTKASQSLLSQLANFNNSVFPDKYAKKTCIKPTLDLAEEKIPDILSNSEIDKKEPIKFVTDYVLENSNSNNTNSDCNMNKSLCSSNKINKRYDVTECKTPVVIIKDFLRSQDISGKKGTPKTLATPTGLPQLPASLCHLVSESFTSTSTSCSQTSSHSHTDDIDRTASTPTIGTIVQAAGTKNASMSCVEESEKPHFDSHPTIPSQVPLQSNIPETPMLEVSRISVTSDEKSTCEKLNCSILKPQWISKQENRASHKHLNVRNAERGMRPLHPLQIPPYPHATHAFNSNSEHVIHNARNSSLYYPYCWQWPVHTPGSDPAVSPLNLCTIQKSPNNYSPITPTSPISPNYPTQAQGVTQSDLSPIDKKEKPLWYPWLKVDSTKPEIKVCNITSGINTMHHKTPIKMSRISSTPQNKPNEQEKSNILFMEPAETNKSNHETRLISEFRKHSPEKLNGPVILSRPASLEINDVLSNPGLVSNFIETSETACDLECGNLPSTSYSESLRENNIKTLSETSNIIISEAKQSSRIRKTHARQGSISDNVSWHGDTAMTPDSLDSCQSNCSSYTCTSHVNEKTPLTPEAAENRSKLYADSSHVTKTCDSEQEMLKLHGVRKQREKFRLSTPGNQPSNSSHCEPEWIRPRDCVVTKHIIGGSDNIEHYYIYQETASKTAETSGGNNPQTL